MREGKMEEGSVTRKVRGLQVKVVREAGEREPRE